MPRAAKVPKGKNADAKAAKPKPLTVYLTLLIVIFAFIPLAYFSRDFITGMITGTGGAQVGTPAIVEERPQLPQEPVCSAGCGTPCPLANSGGLPAADFTASGGRIGILGCDGMCYSTREHLDNLHCCFHKDCPPELPACVKSTTTNANCGMP